jgi:hypothetical protein
MSAIQPPLKRTTANPELQLSLRYSLVCKQPEGVNGGWFAGMSAIQHEFRDVRNGLYHVDARAGLKAASHDPSLEDASQLPARTSSFSITHRAKEMRRVGKTPTSCFAC